MSIKPLDVLHGALVRVSVRGCAPRRLEACHRVVEQQAHEVPGVRPGVDQLRGAKHVPAHT
eukprot:scaffold123743_cov57-Phaeocystis_antarctica.AAC.1